MVAEYTYTAYGEVSVTNYNGNTLGSYNPLRYRGYYYDRDTGFYYLQTRYYDPKVGRIINLDGLVNSGGLLGYNMFAYCENNPSCSKDSSGGRREEAMSPQEETQQQRIESCQSQKAETKRFLENKKEAFNGSYENENCGNSNNGAKTKSEVEKQFLINNGYSNNSFGVWEKKVGYESWKTVRSITYIPPNEMLAYYPEFTDDFVVIGLNDFLPFAEYGMGKAVSWLGLGNIPGVNALVTISSICKAVNTLYNKGMVEDYKYYMNNGYGVVLIDWQYTSYYGVGPLETSMYPYH